MGGLRGREGSHFCWTPLVSVVSGQASYKFVLCRCVDPTRKTGTLLKTKSDVLVTYKPRSALRLQSQYSLVTITQFLSLTNGSWCVHRLDLLVVVLGAGHHARNGALGLQSGLVDVPDEVGDGRFACLGAEDDGDVEGNHLAVGVRKVDHLLAARDFELVERTEGPVGDHAQPGFGGSPAAHGEGHGAAVGRQPTGVGAAEEPGRPVSVYE